MTGFVRNSVGTTVPATPHFSSATTVNSELTSEQLAQCRAYLNCCDHPVIVLDTGFRVALRNEAMRRKLTDTAAAVGTEQPSALIWQTVCDSAARIISELADSPTNEISEAFPVGRRCYIAVGSFLRNGVGRIVGAVVNLGDITESGKKLSDNLTDRSQPFTQSSLEGSATPVDTEEFQEWTSHRNQARQKMSRLSRREAQVVELVSDGLPNKSIAHVLDISVKTIEKHRANATRKLGVGSTAEMVRIAVVADNKSPVAEATATAHSETLN